MTTEVQRVVQSILLPLIMLNSKVFNILFIIFGVSLYSPLAPAVGILLALFLVLFFIYMLGNYCIFTESELVIYLFKEMK